MRYFIYRTTNLVNWRVYIGAHATDDLNDGYLGSGVALKLAIKRYGREAFQREVIFEGSTVAEMYEHERLLVNKEFIARRDTYNMKPGGYCGGGRFGPCTERQKRLIAESVRRSFLNPERLAAGRKPRVLRSVAPGDRFGRLTVVARSDDYGETWKRRSRVVCTCDCGGSRVVAVGDLRKGDTRSCGCLTREHISEVNNRHKTKRGLPAPGVPATFVWSE